MRCSFVATRGQKFAAGRRRSIAGAISRFNDHRHGSSIPIRRDKQMPNTAVALLDTVTELAIAVESGRRR
jgi:hypothetical protein